MKLFNKKFGNKTININGKNVKFVNSVAEVEDEFGEEILKLGFPNLYEYGKQPAVELPKELELKSDFADKEAFYQKEIKRLSAMEETRKTRIKELEVEVQNWKAEYEKEYELRIKGLDELLDTVQPPLKVVNETDPVDSKNPEIDTIKDGDTEELTSEELRAEFSEMTKKELIAFGEELKLDMSSLANANKEKIIDFLVENSKE